MVCLCSLTLFSADYQISWINISSTFCFILPIFIIKYLYKINWLKAVGAVGGAATAWALNMIPSVGQMAYGGALIGGAVGNSAVTAAGKILNLLIE